jgi:radical SAM superfamily enzyme YgiQ (UPF0313 family)
MKDCVLVNPRIVGSDNDPSLGLLSLAAYVRSKGYSVTLIDAQALKLSDSQVASQIMQLKPLLVGITFMTSQEAITRSLVKTLRRLAQSSHQDLMLVAGGIHASVLPDETLKLGFDFVIVGEGEQTLEELLSVLRSKPGNFDKLKIDGLYTKDGEFTPRKLIDNLDSLPLPAWDLAPIKYYQCSDPDLRYQRDRGVTLNIYTSRGCIYNCTFCASHGVYGHVHRERSAKKVVDEIELLGTKYDVTRFFIVDESIFNNAKHAEEFADEILKRGLQIRFASPARVSDPGINLVTLRKMHDAGMVRVDFGVESGSERILKDIQKGITREQIIRAHKLAHEAGLKTVSLMIAGHLEETWSDVIDSLELVAELDTDFAEFGPMTPYPGTACYKKALKEGWIRNKDWSLYYISNPYRVMRSRCFSYQEVYLLGLLCTDAARCMIDYKKKTMFRQMLKSSPIGLKPIGRYLVIKYMLTHERKYLQQLCFGHLKWHPKDFANPEDASLLVGIRRSPFSIFKKEHKLRLLRMIIPLFFSQAKEYVSAKFYERYYASKLQKELETV